MARNPLLTSEERNAEARFDRALRSAHAKLVHALDQIQAASATQRKKIHEARERIEEAIAMQDDIGYRRQFRQVRTDDAQTTKTR